VSCFRYSEEQRGWLMAYVPGHSAAECADAFNARFGTALTASQVRAFRKNHGVKSGRDTRFKPGHETYRPPKGTRSSPATEFKPGHVPWDKAPVGALVRKADGYLWRKVAETRPSRFGWRQEHRLVWERANGPVPEGCCVLFLDGDRSNVAPENLALVTRSQLSTVNRYGLLSQDPELTRAGLALADLKSALRRRQGGGGRKEER